VTKAVGLVSAQRSWVRMLPGEYFGTGTLYLGGNFTLVATGATTPQAIATSDPANVTVRGLTTSSIAQCSSSNAVLTLRNVKASSLVGGSSTGGCQVAALECEFGPSDVYLAYNTVVNIERSKLLTIHLSRDPATTGFSFRMTGSFARAMDFTNLLSQPASIYIAHNTFFATVGTPTACGADADTPVGITFVNNIFYAPSFANAASNQGTKCGFDTNIIFPLANAIGTNTIVMDPGLVDASTGDVHLIATSPAIDAAKTIANAPVTDYYGTPRPQGTRSDIGAVEYK